MDNIYIFFYKPKHIVDNGLHVPGGKWILNTISEKLIFIFDNYCRLKKEFV